MRLAINRPSILLCPYYLKEGEKKITDRENVRGGRNGRASLVRWSAKAIQRWCGTLQFTVCLQIHEAMELRPPPPPRHHSYLTDEDTEPARGRAEPEPVLWLEAFCTAGSRPIQQTGTLLSDKPRAIDTLTNGVYGPS